MSLRTRMPPPLLIPPLSVPPLRIRPLRIRPLPIPAFRRTALLLAALLAAASFLSAQTQQAPTTLTVTTRLVLLDTTVVDAQGKPVLGLTARDFAVYEDGVQQKIATFDIPGAHTLPAGETRATIFNAADPAPFGNSPVNLLVLDEVNTHFGDIAYGKHSLELYLRARPDTLAQPTALLVVHDSRFEQLVPFTLDRDKLLAALHAHVPEQAWQLEQSNSVGEGVGVRLDLSLSALEQIVQYAARIPGHKNLVWVGVGFPSVDPAALTPGTDRALKHMLQHVSDTLLDARASLYAVDPTSTLPTVTEITNPVQLEFAQATDGGRLHLDPFDHTLDFDRLAPVTGGRVFRGLNDIDREVNESIVTGSAYYTLGYRPRGDSSQPGQFRKIKVVCLRPGLTATTHDGYYTSASATTLATDTIGYDLNNAATASVPFNAIAFTVDKGDSANTADTTNPAATGAYTLHVRSADLDWHTRDEASTATVQVLVVALGAKGKILAHSLHNETATATAGTDTHASGQRVRFTAGLAPTAKTEAKVVTLRFVVRDSFTGHMGTVDLPARP